MPATYEPIATTTLSSAASTITFSSIGAGYTDLRLVLVPTAATSAADIKLQFNSDTATNYSVTYLQGDGTSASSGRATSQNQIYLTYGTAMSTTIPTLRTVDIFSYAGSTNKTCLVTESDDLNGSGYVSRMVGLWRSTSAITTITLTGVSNFATGTTATLYGILKA